MQQIESFLLDLGNVIVDIELEATPRALKKLKHPEIDPEEAERAMLQLERQFETGRLSEDAFINGILRHAREGTQALDVVRAWNAMLIGIPKQRLLFLEQLNDQFPVYIVSNTNPLHIHWLQRQLQSILKEPSFVPRFARATYYSHEVELRKPDPQIFQHIIEDSGIRPESTLYLDDTLDHIGTGLQLGFQAVQLPPEVEWMDWMKAEGLTPA